MQELIQPLSELGMHGIYMVAIIVITGELKPILKERGLSELVPVVALAVAGVIAWAVSSDPEVISIVKNSLLYWLGSLGTYGIYENLLQGDKPKKLLRALLQDKVTSK